MKYTIIKFFVGNFELSYGDKKVVLTDEKPSIIVEDDDYELILEKYESMILHGMILIQRIEPKIEVKEDKKFNKK